MHYSLLFDAIATAIQSAWKAETTSPGRAAKPTRQLPRATITLDTVTRNAAGRSIEQVWAWSIFGEFGLPTRAGTDPQELVASKAEALIELLTPFSTDSDSIPPVPSPFGGVGYMPIVASWSPIPLEDEENGIGVKIEFLVRTTVWQ